MLGKFVTFGVNDVLIVKLIESQDGHVYRVAAAARVTQTVHFKQPNNIIWLVQSDHVSLILAADWSSDNNQQISEHHLGTSGVVWEERGAVRSDLLIKSDKVLWETRGGDSQTKKSNEDKIYTKSIIETDLEYSHHNDN